MQHPQCTLKPAECRIQDHGSTTMLLSWTPTYDGNGQRVGPRDPNTRMTSLSCLVCQRRWIENTSHDKTTVSDC